MEQACDGAQPSPQPQPGLLCTWPPPAPAWTPGGGWGHRAERLQLQTSARPPPSLSAPSLLFCQQQLLATEGHQSQRGLRTFSSSLGPHPLPSEVRGGREKESHRDRVRVK